MSERDIRWNLPLAQGQAYEAVALDDARYLQQFALIAEQEFSRKAGLL